MNVDRLGQVSGRRAIMLLGVFIVVAGFAVGLVSGFSSGLFGTFSSSPAALGPYAAGVQNGVGGLYANGGYTQLVASSSTTLSTTSIGGNPGQGNAGSSYSTNTTGGTGSLLEFSSTLNIESLTPQSTAGRVVAMAYEVGGYVAYQSTYQNYAEVVIRVPAAQYQTILAKVEALGKVTSLTSNSNDVTVQYTDLNATLQSLRTEEGALLRLLNQSASINTTLAIETQLQSVDAQINSVESQILQTKTLVDYSTLDVTISESPQTAPLTIVLRAAPENGTAPFSVTFNAIVKGGAQPYVVNFNWGDGSADQGQILIHTYYQAGDYKVTAVATDQNGTAVIATAKIHVDAPPGQSGVAGFLGTVSNLFVNVVEGIVEVAVVVLPLAAVGAVVILPFKKKFRAQKEIRQG